METNALWLWVAAGLSLFTFALHSFATRHDIVQPLLEADLHRVSKYTHYYCWHMVTITLFAMAAFYAVAAQFPSAWELAAVSTGLAMAFALWSIALVVWKRQKMFELPQWTLFIVISAAGAMGFI
ncbi:MAG: hypothetical protein AAFQ10_15730 [Pseudomonadota bacterium]